ncbi:MAG: transglutaminase family protein [Candidatus Eremiobacterota bacterium]
MSLQYAVRHVTRIRYREPVRENLVELRMQPRSEDQQICLAFDLQVVPTARIQSFRDYLGNTVHHFDVPHPHQDLEITALARVQVSPPPPLPNRVDVAAWEELERCGEEGDFFDFLTPTSRTRTAPALEQFGCELGVEKREDPLTLLRELNQGLSGAIAYAPRSTEVDTPLEEVLERRRGVCQDYAHLFLALARPLGIPCRYVSGYLYHREQDTSTPDASHAWVEAFVPPLGWVGFDPTNNLVAAERHIRTALGRDYTDVPPNRGTHKGSAECDLSVAVQVRLAGQPMAEDRFRSFPGEGSEPPSTPGWYQAQQAQQ